MRKYDVSYTVTASVEKSAWVKQIDGYLDLEAGAGRYLCAPPDAVIERVQRTDTPLPIGTIVSYADADWADIAAGGITPFRIKVSHGNRPWRWVDGNGTVDDSVLQSDGAVLRAVDAKLIYQPAEDEAAEVEWRVSFVATTEFDGDRGDWQPWDAHSGRQRLDPAPSDPYIIVPEDAQIREIYTLTDGLYIVRDEHDRWVTHQRVMSGDHPLWNLTRASDGAWSGSYIISYSNEDELHAAGQLKRIGDLPRDTE